MALTGRSIVAALWRMRCWVFGHGEAINDGNGIECARCGWQPNHPEPPYPW